MSKLPFLEDATIKLQTGRTVVVEMIARSEEDAERLYEAVTDEFVNGMVVSGEIEISTPASVERGSTS